MWVPGAPVEPSGLSAPWVHLGLLCKPCFTFIKDHFPRDSKNVLDYASAFKKYKVGADTDLWNDVRGKLGTEKGE